jgi:hypothetical protein
MSERSPQQGDYHNQLKLKEYDQICQDWRHRDTLLWQTLAVSITISGLVFTQIFNPEIKWPVNIMVSVALLAINLVLLQIITKHHFYQHGSSELLKKMGQDAIIQELITTYPEFADESDRINSNLRIWRPTKSFSDSNVEKSRIPFPEIYFWLSRRSGFKAYFSVQLMIIVLNLLLIAYFVCIS